MTVYTIVGTSQTPYSSLYKCVLRKLELNVHIDNIKIILWRELKENVLLVVYFIQPLEIYLLICFVICKCSILIVFKHNVSAITLLLFICSFYAFSWDLFNNGSFILTCFVNVK